jgi:hypothetical protein
VLLLAPDDWTDTWLARSLSSHVLGRCWGRGHGRLEEAGLRTAPGIGMLVKALTRSQTERTRAVVFGRYSAEVLRLARAFRTMGTALIWLDAPSLNRITDREIRNFRSASDRLLLSDTTAIAQWRAYGVEAQAVSSPLCGRLEPRERAREALDLTPRARSIAIVLTDRALARALTSALNAFATLVARFASIDARIVVPPMHAATVGRMLESRPFGVRPQMIHLDLVGKNRSQLSGFDIVWSDDRFSCMVAAACGVPSVYVATASDGLLERSDARWWWQALSGSILHAESWQAAALVEQTELLIDSTPSRRERIADTPDRDGARDLERALGPWLATLPVSGAQPAR